jgi:hypothetical protein
MTSWQIEFNKKFFGLIRDFSAICLLIKFIETIRRFKKKYLWIITVKNQRKIKADKLLAVLIELFSKDVM